MSWWRRLLLRERVERQLDAELRDHVERLVADGMRAGLSEAEARRRARLAFGGLDQVKEQCRDVRGTRWIDDIVQDVRYGLRLLRQSPAFTIVAVASLALGIGANSAIFALVDGVLLKTLPVREPQSLVLLDDGSWTNAIWEEIRNRQTELFEGAMAWSEDRFDLASGGSTDFVNGLWVSGGFFDVLGVPALRGRPLRPADDRRDGGPDGPVAVISHAFWQRHYAGAGDVIGRTLLLDRVPFTIVGVTPPAFLGPRAGRSFDVAVPIGTQAIVRGDRAWLDRRLTWVLDIMARTRPGQTAEEATLALRAVQPQIREATRPAELPSQFQANYLREAFTLKPSAAGPGELRERYERPLLIVMAVVVLVLLIACANIANLMLARAAARRHELTVRVALGASRFRVARQLMVESLLLAAIGAGVGLIFAQWGSRLIVRQLATPRGDVALDLALDWRVLAFTMAVAVATAILFGMAPALRVRRVDPVVALKEQGRTFAGDQRRLPGGPLLVVQVALTLVLVVAAGLFVRTFATLATLDLGLDGDPLLLVEMNASRSTVPADARLALFERVQQAAASVPGVASTALSLITPVRGDGWNGPVELPDRPDVPVRERMTFYNSVSPGWFATYGTRLLAGREFEPRDTFGAPLVGIVNETFARKYIKGDPVGQTVKVETGPDGTVVVEVVGLAEDSAYRSVKDPVPPVLFRPVAQGHHEEQRTNMSLTVRAAGGSPTLLVRSLTDTIAQIDRDVALTFRPLSAYVDGALVRERLLAILSGFFGLLALVLGGIGLYGMTSFAVTRRRAEIGIRMALGAQSSWVVALLMRRVAVPVALGVAAGIGLSLWSARYVGSLLYGLQPRDPWTLAGASIFLVLVSAIAAWIPASRAARIDPASVLRDA